jgi:hypothetical protein
VKHMIHTYFTRFSTISRSSASTHLSSLLASLRLGADGAFATATHDDFVQLLAQKLAACPDEFSDWAECANETSAFDASVARGMTGISNFGETCFMSAAAQILARIPGLIGYFASPALDADLRPGAVFAREFANLAHLLLIGCHEYIVPHRARNVMLLQFGRGLNLHRGQHDALEFIDMAIDRIHQDLNRGIGGHSDNVPRPAGQSDTDAADAHWAELHRHQNSAMHDAVQSQLASRLECPRVGCGHVSVTFDPTTVCRVDIPAANPKSITALLFPAARNAVAERMTVVLWQAVGVSARWLIEDFVSALRGHWLSFEGNEPLGEVRVAKHASNGASLEFYHGKAWLPAASTLHVYEIAAAGDAVHAPVAAAAELAPQSSDAEPTDVLVNLLVRFERVGGVTLAPPHLVSARLPRRNATGAHVSVPVLERVQAIAPGCAPPRLVWNDARAVALGAPCPSLACPNRNAAAMAHCVCCELRTADAFEWSLANQPLQTVTCLFPEAATQELVC